MTAYVRLLAGAGYPVTVFSSFNRTDGESVRLDSRVRLVQEPASDWGGFRRSRALWRQAQGAEFALVHSHGLWTDVNRLAADIARRRSLPHVLAPCGMLAPGALRRHWWKKAPIRFWFQDRALREAQCLHAKSKQEYEQIRRFGLRNPVAIIPNPIGGRPPTTDCGPRDHGLQDPETTGPGERSTVRSPWSVVPNCRTVLFLGRLHPVKGVARLVEAWARIQTRKAESRKQKLPQSTEVAGRGTRDWVLLLAGPDEAGMRPALEATLRARGCAQSVIFTGQLDEGQKWAAYQAADLFVMPSDFENFGNAIVEAMCCGIPVITTTGTPWEELRTAGAGWWVPPTVADLALALGDALALPDDQRQAMGRRALPIAERFRPERVAADLIHVYEWLLGREERPGCVML